jgi:hypothetical protein
LGQQGEDIMTPDVILGWTVAESGKRSHVIGSAEFVVGMKTPGVVTVVSSLCGTKGHSDRVQDEPNGIPCSKCLSAAFKQAESDELPDMTVPEGGWY